MGGAAYHRFSAGWSRSGSSTSACSRPRRTLRTRRRRRCWAHASAPGCWARCPPRARRSRSSARRARSPPPRARTPATATGARATRPSATSSCATSRRRSRAGRVFITGDTHYTMVYDRDGLFEARPCPLDIPIPNDITLIDPLAAASCAAAPAWPTPTTRRDTSRCSRRGAEDRRAHLDLTLCARTASRPIPSASRSRCRRTRRATHRGAARRRPHPGRRPGAGAGHSGAGPGRGGGLPFTGGRPVVVALAGAVVAAAGLVARTVGIGADSRRRPQNSRLRRPPHAHRRTHVHHRRRGHLPRALGAAPERGLERGLVRAKLGVALAHRA